MTLRTRGRMTSGSPCEFDLESKMDRYSERTFANGNYIYYRSDQDGKLWGIFVMCADGSGQRLLINNVPPDGERWPYETLSIGP